MDASGFYARQRPKAPGNAGGLTEGNYRVPPAAFVSDKLFVIYVPALLPDRMAAASRVVYIQPTDCGFPS